MTHLRLGLNIDHVATVRNARGSGYPDPVRAAFLALDAWNAGCFRPSPAGRWLADIYKLARRQLQALGVNAVYGGHCCTFSEPERFFSYRREQRTGRMATLIGLE